MKLWAKILITVLVLALLGGGIFGIVKLADEGKLDSKKVSDLAFSIGGLDGAGNYKNTDASIYTKNAFECQGLECTLDFDAEIWYQIYFYDQNNEFVHTTGKLTGAFVKDSVPFFAKYARIVITPNDDDKVSTLEVLKYAKQLNVKVYREQGFKNYTENLFVIAETGKVISGTDGQPIATQNEPNNVVCEYINIASYKEAMLFRSMYSDISASTVYLYDAQKQYVGYILIGESSKVIFETSEGIKYFSVNWKDVTIHTSEYCVDHEPMYIRLSTHDSATIGVYCR